MIESKASTLGGRYRLEEVIGRGGMSTVYRATDDQLGRTVAVKVLLPALADQDPSYAARFQREARAAAALASAAVVTVYDTGVDEASQYIVMEYVDGQSLADALRDERPLPLPEAVRIAERVAAALAAAHAAGILHRDIKPANVMVGSDGTVKLLDFGIARKLDGTTLTQVASVIGTAAYMAPERAVGEAGDARADIYSLGCLLYAMLTGRPPFSGEVAAAVLHQQINVPPRAPSELRSAIPPALDALVLRMLAKSPEDRPNSVREVGSRLAELTLATATGETTAPTAALAGTSVTAPLRRKAPPAARAGAAVAAPGPAPRRPGLADHRRRAIVMALATGAVTVAALALFSIGGSSRHPVGVTHPVTHGAPPASRTTVPATTAPGTTTPRPPTTQPAKPAKPAKPKAHGGGGPPGHGGGAAGKAKKNGD